MERFGRMQPTQLQMSEAGRLSVDASPTVCVVGCGYWGKNLVRNFHQCGALQSVWDSTARGRQTAWKLVPGVRMRERYEQALESPAAGVVIATPAETHFDLARRALAAGKDLFVEKPLALTYEEGVELVETARRLRRILMVG